MAGCIIGRALYEGTLTLPDALAAAGGAAKQGLGIRDSKATHGKGHCGAQRIGSHYAARMRPSAVSRMSPELALVGIGRLRAA